VSQRLGQLTRWLRSLPAARSGLVVGLAVFVLLALLFLATGDQLASALGQAAFWGVFAFVAAFAGRMLGARRRPRGPGEPQ
jgi:hypothetical protein